MLWITWRCLALNRSAGHRWMPIPRPPPQNFDRLCGTHSVLNALRAHRHQRARQEASTDSTGTDRATTPIFRSHMACLYVRDFSVEEPHQSGSGGGGGGDAKGKRKVIPPQYSAVHRITALAKSMEVPLHFVPRRELRELCGERRNQNVVLEASSFVPTTAPSAWAPFFESVAPQTTSDSCGTPPVVKTVLVLDHLMDPTNIGTILRTAFFFGVQDVVLSKDCAGCTAAVSRSSAGLLEYMNVVRATCSTEVFLRNTMKDHADSGVAQTVELQILASHTRSTMAPREDDDDGAATVAGQRSPPAVQCRLLILGNEGEGLGASVLKLCSHLVHIRSPQHQRMLAESNTAAAVIGHDDDAEALVDQRRRSVEKLARLSVGEVSLNVGTACATILSHLQQWDGTPTTSPAAGLEIVHNDRSVVEGRAPHATAAHEPTQEHN